MSPEIIFTVTTGIALFGWLILFLLSPFVLEIDKFLIGVIICLLALVYAWLLIRSFHPSDALKFTRLGGVMELFQNKIIVTAGWVHYLALDLLTGIWIRRNADKYGFPYGVVVLCLLITMMIAPVGILVYLVIRAFRSGNYFSSNY
jgi:hypothetical protein